jgi:hypothetical protein
MVGATTTPARRDLQAVCATAQRFVYQESLREDASMANRIPRQLIAAFSKGTQVLPARRHAPILLLLLGAWLGAHFYVLYTRPPVVMSLPPAALRWEIMPATAHWRPVQTYPSITPCLADMAARRAEETWTTTEADGTITRVIAQYVCLRNDLDPNRARP